MLCRLPIILISTACLGATNLLAMQESRFVTKNDGWFVSSPALNRKPTFRTLSHNEETHSTVEFLRHTGQQAHDIWLAKRGSQDALVSFQDLFNPIDREFLYELINQILTNETLLNNIAQDSYRNVTGFLKIVLATGEDNDSWKIRLHVWEQKEEKEFPHNHKWDFYSKIISGYLLQDIYATSDIGCDSQNAHSVCEPVSLMPLSESGVMPCPCRDNYILNPKNTDAPSVSLRLHSTDIIGTGESYMMPNHLVHAITPGRGSISLVFTSQKVTDNSDVFVPMDKVNTDLTRYAPSVTPEELKTELLKVQKILRQLCVNEKYLPEMINHDHHYYHMNGNDPITQSSQWRADLYATSKRTSVIQLSPDEMIAYRVTADPSGNMLINHQAIDANRDYLFVLFNNVFYAAPKDFHHISNTLICHTSFSDYGPIDSAGVLHFDVSGNLKTIEAYSGHYCPSLDNMKSAKEYLDTIGVNTADATLTPYQDRIIPPTSK